MHTILPPQQFKQLPWKNGKGFTTELAISLDGTVDKFDWRVSIASVSEDGVFSDFSGYARNLVLIEGNGLKLEHSLTGRETTSDQLDDLLDFATFDGAAHTVSTLNDGAIKDLNIMVDELKYTATVKTYKHNQTIILDEADVCFVYCLDSPAQFTAKTSNAETLPVGHLLQISEPSDKEYSVAGQQMIVASFKKIC